MPGAKYYDGKKLNIPVSKESGIELYQRWTIQGLSSLISAIAQKELIYFFFQLYNAFASLSR